jgi:hypothetical protein
MTQQDWDWLGINAAMQTTQLSAAIGGRFSYHPEYVLDQAHAQSLTASAQFYLSALQKTSGVSTLPTVLPVARIAESPIFKPTRSSLLVSRVLRSASKSLNLREPLHRQNLLPRRQPPPSQPVATTLYLRRSLPLLRTWSTVSKVLAIPWLMPGSFPLASKSASVTTARRPSSVISKK